LRVPQLPRMSFAQLPTPLEEAKRLGEALGGPRIFLKRDDLTGAGLGGNKVRKLEYVIARAVAEGADTLVACGGYQSNMARITAALGARAGLRVELVLGGMAGESRAWQGNLLLDRLYGARVHFIETERRWEFGSALQDLAAELTRQGRHPYVIPLGGSSPEGMASYINATDELLGQLSAAGVRADHLYVAVGSGGTFCGLALGAVNAPAPYRLVGISVSRGAGFLRERVVADSAAAAGVLQVARTPQASDFAVYDEYIGPGYGALTKGCVEAISLVARTEGVLLDPVYSGKAMHGLMDHIRSGKVSRDDTVVFLHTGGSPALFAYDPDSLSPADVQPHTPGASG